MDREMPFGTFWGVISYDEYIYLRTQAALGNGAAICELTCRSFFLERDDSEVRRLLKLVALVDPAGLPFDPVLEPLLRDREEGAFDINKYWTRDDVTAYLEGCAEVDRERRFALVVWKRALGMISDDDFCRVTLEAAEAGCRGALGAVGSTDGGDERRRRRCLRRGAERGFERAAFVYGTELIGDDVREGRRWLESAAARGYVCAEGWLASISADLGRVGEAFAGLRRARRGGGMLAQIVTSAWIRIEKNSSGRIRRSAARHRVLSGRLSLENRGDATHSNPFVIEWLLEGDGCEANVDEARALWLTFAEPKQFRRRP
jgi:hypothetical protein